MWVTCWTINNFFFGPISSVWWWWTLVFFTLPHPATHPTWRPPRQRTSAAQHVAQHTRPQSRRAPQAPRPPTPSLYPLPPRQRTMPAQSPPHPRPPPLAESVSRRIPTTFNLLFLLLPLLTDELTHSHPPSTGRAPRLLLLPSAQSARAKTRSPSTTLPTQRPQIPWSPGLQSPRTMERRSRRTAVSPVAYVTVLVGDDM